MIRPLLYAAKAAAELVTTEGKVSARANPALLAESIGPLSEGAQGAVRRATLTLNKAIDTVKEVAKEEVTIVSPKGSRTFILERGAIKTTEPSVLVRSIPSKGMHETEANTYFAKADVQQDSILAHNYEIAMQNPESLGKFAQYGLFKPLQKRFSETSKNKDWNFFATADGSAADLVGADGLLLNRQTKQFFPIDFKHSNQLKDVPVARASGILSYNTDYFKMVGGNWAVLPRTMEFRTFISESAQQLVSITERRGLFSLQYTPFPSLSASSITTKIAEIRRFQIALQCSRNRHLNEYGEWLHKPLSYLKSRM